MFLVPLPPSHVNVNWYLPYSSLSAGLASYVETIETAKVPIVKFDHKRTGISVDICVNNDR